MTRFLLAGGGTGGHVNPLLALAQQLRAEGHDVLALGTKEGLETRLVPERGFELKLVQRLPFPRKFNRYALVFPWRFVGAVSKVMSMIRNHKIECIVGFGGYASAPAYVAAYLMKRPIVVHEANALSGFANRLGAKLTKSVAVAFPNSDLKGSLTGMPLREEIVASLNSTEKGQARVELGLDPVMPTLLVTGGSLGAKSINEAVGAALPKLIAAGIQVYHIVGDGAGLEDHSESGYVRVRYCSAMDVAIAASDFAISRAGSSTVSEFSAAGLPALYVPYPVGNGEQRLNAVAVCDAGGGILVSDKDLTVEYIESEVIPRMSHAQTLKAMSAAAKTQGIPDSTQLLRDLVLETVNTKQRD